MKITIVIISLVAFGCKKEIVNKVSNSKPTILTFTGDGSYEMCFCSGTLNIPKYIGDDPENSDTIRTISIHGKVRPLWLLRIWDTKTGKCIASNANMEDSCFFKN